ncbi:MAG: hypothetical protein AAFV47_06965 [Pseudomonadota bacterium]
MTQRSIEDRMAKGDGRDRFFLWMALALLAFVIIGFAPSFFLRPITDVPPLRTHILIHAVSLTAWFVWFVGQSAMIQTGRVRLHRTLGIVGALIGAVCVFTGPLATTTAIESLLATGVSWESDMSEEPTRGIEGISVAQFGPALVFGNIASTIAFAVLLAAGVHFRNRRDFHKRLMLLASISFIGPAISRIARWPVFRGEDGLFIPVAFGGLLMAIWLYDRRSLGYIHKATLLGSLTLVGLLITGLVFSATPWGLAIAKSMA